MSIVLGGKFRGTGGLGTGVADNRGSVEYARVIDVVLDSSHREWKKRGYSQSLYGILYQSLYRDENDDPVKNPNMGFAYCGNPHFRRIPTKNEIVTLVSRTSAEYSEEMGSNVKVQKTYWEDIIPVWNVPNVNPYPDTIKYKGTVDLGPDFKEQPKIKPLFLGTGDISFEGRYGNSIRFGGTRTKNSPIASDDTNGNPYIIIRNGQGVDGEYAVKEDINKDKSSIYITSEHKVPLVPSATKRSAWKNRKGPESSSSYKGAQIVINSDRVWVNSKKNDIEFSAKEEFGVTAKVVSLDGSEYIAFDATKIYLGTMAFQELQPVLLGKMTTKWLDSLCQVLHSLLTVMSTITVQTLPSLAGAATAATPSLLALKNTLGSLHSKKAFVQ